MPDTQWLGRQTNDVTILDSVPGMGMGGVIYRCYYHQNNVGRMGILMALGSG